MRVHTKVQATFPEQTAIARAASAIRDAIRRASTTAPAPQRDKYIENLWRREGKQQLGIADHEMAILYNAFQRGASQEALEAPFHAGLACVRSWCETRGDRSTHDIPTLCRLETVAQGVADVAEWDLVNADSKTLAAADDALSVHLAMLSRLVNEVRRRRYAGASPNQAA